MTVPRLSLLNGRTAVRAIEPSLSVAATIVVLVAPTDVSFPLSVALLVVVCVRLGSRGGQRAAFDAAAIAFSLAVVAGYLLAPSPSAEARVEGIAAALAVYLAVSLLVRGADHAVRAALTLMAVLALGVAAEVVLLRGAYPPAALAPPMLTALLQTLPDVRTDPLDMNARFAVHAYGVAQLALIGLALSTAWAIHGVGSRRRIAALLVMGLCVLLVALSQSRGALLAALIVLPVVGAFRSWRWWIGVPLSGLALVVLNLSGVLARGPDADWLSLRVYAWSGSLNLLAERPLTGVALGMRAAAERFATQFALDDPHTISHAHNVFLQAYVEMGPLGFAALTMFCLSALWITARLGAASGSPRVVASGVCGAFAASSISGLADAIPTSDLGLMLLFVLAALAVPASSEQIAAIPASRGVWIGAARRVPLALVLGVALLFSGAVVALWPPTASALQLNRAAYALSDPSPTTEQAALAENAATGAVRLQPARAAGYRFQAWARLARGDIAGTLAALEAARALPGISGYEQFQLGRIYQVLGQTSDVVPLWINAGEGWRLEPWAADLVATRHLDDAEKVYRGLLVFQPDNADVLGELGVLILRQRGDLSEALALLERAAEHEPAKRESLAEYILERGVSRRIAAARQRGNLDEALLWLRAAAAFQPDAARPHLELGRGLALAGDLDAARAEIERALEIQPDHPEARRELLELGG